LIWGVKSGQYCVIGGGSLHIPSPLHRSGPGGCGLGPSLKVVLKKFKKSLIYIYIYIYILFF